MKIIIEDVPEQLVRELVKIAATHGVNIALFQDEGSHWTIGRAISLLRDLPEVALEVIKITVDGDGWGDANKLQENDRTSLASRTGSITKAVQRGVRMRRLPEGLPSPISAAHGPHISSGRRTRGFAMQEELLPVFREALKSL